MPTRSLVPICKLQMLPPVLVFIPNNICDSLDTAADFLSHIKTERLLAESVSAIESKLIQVLSDASNLA